MIPLIVLLLALNSAKDSGLETPTTLDGTNLPRQATSCKETTNLSVPVLADSITPLNGSSEARESTNSRTVPVRTDRTSVLTTTQDSRDAQNFSTQGYGVPSGSDAIAEQLRRSEAPCVESNLSAAYFPISETNSSGSVYPQIRPWADSANTWNRLVEESKPFNMKDLDKDLRLSQPHTRDY